MAEHIPAALREFVARRASHRCEYCRAPARFSAASLCVEHIIPRSRGGLSDGANLALSCQSCNNHKFTHTTATDAVSGCMVPMFHPRRDRWRTHFKWSTGGTMIVARPAIGRATIELLRLNRDGLVNLRRLLANAGVRDL